MTRLADGLSRSDQNRIIHNLAAAYRKESGRAAINGLAKSDIVYTYRTGHLSDKVVNVGGQQVLGQRFGETEPHLHGATDSTGHQTPFWTAFPDMIGHTKPASAPVVDKATCFDLLRSWKRRRVE